MSSRVDLIVPFAVECVPLDGAFRQLLIADSPAFLVCPFVQPGMDLQARLRGRRADRFDQGKGTFYFFLNSKSRMSPIVTRRGPREFPGGRSKSHCEAHRASYRLADVFAQRSA